MSNLLKKYNGLFWILSLICLILNIVMLNIILWIIGTILVILYLLSSSEFDSIYQWIRKKLNAR